MKDNLIVYEGKTKTTYYARIYVNGKRKKINLGHDLPTAIQKLHEMDVHGTVKPQTLEGVWERYSTSNDGLLARPMATQKDYTLCWNKLKTTLGSMDLESIQPMHIKQYLIHRTARIRANREKALVSILFGYARNYCAYNGQNPCLGIKGNKEIGRKKYVEKWEYEAIHGHADPVLKDAMDLLLFTGQRVSDVLDFQFNHIKRNIDLSSITMFQGIPASTILGCDSADMLHVKPSKGKRFNKEINLIIEGELKQVIDRIIKQGKKNTIGSMYLLCNKDGQRLSRYTLDDKFNRARSLAGFGSYEIQLRDLRHKNATNSTLEEAQLRLGHSSVTTTEKYRNNVMTVAVRPLPKLI